MSISVLFTPTGASRDQYDESLRRLRDGGQFPPDGMDYHIALVRMIPSACSRCGRAKRKSMSSPNV